ncbi:LpqN/LpqT family lipoprotein [Mycobacterium sp. M26]|uniref:LpqN/LpqT family lipoprotein n=1 Tax=Mycobacterium sp. M26 TaxID=1762962 RepID=UPI00073EA4BB|nr:LpqN/LpqT family lipoprotein [Mycobacterium sp. M26]
MKNIAAVATAGLVSVGLVLVGCSSATKTEKTEAATTSVVTSSSTAPAAGAAMTINDYITENKIAETPFKPNDPGTPDFNFPFPPDWSLAGDKTPDWAYGAIVYDKPVDPSDPPIMYAIASKLTGNVDAAKILEYAPNQLMALPDFTPVGETKKTSLGGFDAVQSAGTYSRDGKQRIAAQKTVVVPGKDALFVLQLNADALDGQQGVIIDAANLIDEKTTITPPA